MGEVFGVPQLGVSVDHNDFCGAAGSARGTPRQGMLVWRAVTGGVIVILFKTLLPVKIRGGAISEVLPSGLCSFMLTYLQKL